MSLKSIFKLITFIYFLCVYMSLHMSWYSVGFREQLTGVGSFLHHVGSKD